MECWQTLNDGIATVEVAIVPWKELTDQFDELQDWFDELSEQVKHDLFNLDQEEEESTDFSDYIITIKVSVHVGGVSSMKVVPLQDHLLKMEQQSGTLARLTNQKAAVLSRDVCAKHQPAKDLEKQVRRRSGCYQL